MFLLVGANDVLILNSEKVNRTVLHNRLEVKHNKYSKL